jgi:hypothetical protein
MRQLGALILGFLLSLLVGYAVGEAHVYWYMASHGLAVRAELSEDYGFAFDNFIATGIAWLVSLIWGVGCSMRFLGRVRFGEKSGQSNE